MSASENIGGVKPLLLRDKTTLVLPGERINLVGLAERHMPLIVRWRNDPEIQQWFFYRELFTQQSQMAWFQRYLTDASDVSFAIELKTGRAIGTVGIYDIAADGKTAEFGRMLIGEVACRGQGLGDEAAKICLRYADETLRIERILLLVQGANRRAINLYRRLGFAEASRQTREASDGTRHEAIRLYRVQAASSRVG